MIRELIETHNRRYNSQHGEQTLDRLLLVALVGAVLSGTMTIIFLSTAHGNELNPVMRWVIQNSGFAAFGAARVGAVGAWMTAMYWLHRHDHGLAAVAGAGIFAGINLANGLWDVHVVAGNIPDTVATATVSTPIMVVAGVGALILFDRFIGFGHVASGVCQQWNGIDADTRASVRAGSLAVLVVTGGIVGVISLGFGPDRAAADVSDSAEWSVNPSSEIVSVAGGGGSIYTLVAGTVTAYDATTGTEEWNYSVGTNYNRGELVYDPTTDSVYAATDTRAARIDASNGSAVWDISHEREFMAINKDTGDVYIGGYDGSATVIEKLSPSDGSSVASISADSTFQSITVEESTGNVVYGYQVSSSDNYLKAVASDLSSNLWTKSVGGKLAAQDSIGASEGRVYYNHDESGSTVYDATDGSAKYNTSAGDSHSGTAAISTGSSWYATSSTLYEVSESDGSIVDNTSIGFGASHTAAVESSGRVYVGVSGGGSLEVYAAEGLSNPVSGTVKDQHGAPVPGTTVKAVAIQKSALNESDARSLEQQAQDLADQLEDPTPPGWNPDKQLKGSNGYLSQKDSKFVLVHSAEDWTGGTYISAGQMDISEDPDLGSPHLQVDDGDDLVLHIRDGGNNPLYQDSVDSDFAGTTTSGTVVIERLSPSGEAVDSRTVETQPKFDPFGGDMHEAAVVDLPNGFYRVYPESNPAASYVIAVGNPQQMAQQIREDLRDRQDKLTDRAQTIRDKLGKDHIKIIETTTNADGEFSLDVPSNTKLVSIHAMKAGGILKDVDPQNTSVTTMMEQVRAVGYNGSVSWTVTPERVEPPASNVTVTVQRTTVRSDLLEYQNLSDLLEDKLRNWSSNELEPIINGVLENQSADRLAEHKRSLAPVFESNPDLKDRYREILADKRGVAPDQLTVDLTDTSGDAQHLREEVTAMQQALAEIATGLHADESSSVTDRNASYKAVFDGDITEDSVTALVTYMGNGTTESVPDEYVSVDKRPGRGDIVRIDGYPIPADSPGVSFAVTADIQDSSGIVKTTESIKNPAFTGERPGLDSIAVNSLQPQTGETVQIDVSPDDPAAFQNVSSATVIGPDGQTTGATITDADTVQFTPNQTGKHHVRVTYTATDGSQFVEGFKVIAREEGSDPAPKVRVTDGIQVGRYALVSGAEDATVEVNNDGREVVTSVNFASNDDLPANVHVYAEQVQTAPETEYTVRITKGEVDQSISKRIGVTVHTDNLPEEDGWFPSSTVYRNGEPVTRSGSSSGEVTTKQNQSGTTIQTFTDESGEVTIKTDSNPDLSEQVYWFAKQNWPGFIPSPLGLIPDLGGGVGGLMAGLVGLGLIRSRRARLLVLVGLVASAPVVGVLAVPTATAAPDTNSPVTVTQAANIVDYDVPDAVIEYGDTADYPGVIVHVNQSSDLDTLRSWANDSEYRSIIKSDATHEIALVAAPMHDIQPNLVDRIKHGGGHLTSLDYVETVTWNYHIDTPDPVSSLSEQDASMPSSLAVRGEFSTQGLAFANDSKRTTLGDSRDVHGLDNVTATGENTSVYVVDTGVNTANGRVFGNGSTGSSLRIEAAKNFITGETGIQNVTDHSGHGTWTAAAAAANHTNNSYDGMAPDATLGVAKALDEDGGSAYQIAQAIRWSEKQGADVISLSLGSRFYSEELELAIKDAVAGNTTAVVIATGNSRLTTAPGIASPADVDSDGAIAVAATNTSAPSNIGVAYFSQGGPDNGATDLSKGQTRGEMPDFGAPGMSVEAMTPTTDGTVTATTLSGTSMATPEVSGSIAVLLSAEPALKNDTAAVRERLVDTARRAPNAGETGIGHGVPAIDRAIQQNMTDTSQEDVRRDYAVARDTARKGLSGWYDGQGADRLLPRWTVDKLADFSL